MENMEATDQLRGCEVEKLRFSISHLLAFFSDFCAYLW